VLRCGAPPSPCSWSTTTGLPPRRAGDLEDAFAVHTWRAAPTPAFWSGVRIHRGATAAFVVLDFHLPDMNAPAVLRRIASDDHLRAIPRLV